MSRSWNSSARGAVNADLMLRRPNRTLLDLDQMMQMALAAG